MVLRELLDKKLWKIPDRIKDKGKFEENINQSIRQYNPRLLAGKAEPDERPPWKGNGPLPAKQTAR